MARIGMHEAKTNLSRLVERAEAGEEIVIQRNGKPVARLTAIDEDAASIGDLYGVWRGKVHIADDFDELPEDIARAFGDD
jgi:prevent-host-death family protein